MHNSFNVLLNGEHKFCQINQIGEACDPATGRGTCSYTLYDVGEYGFIENPTEHQGDFATLVVGHMAYLRKEAKYYLTLSGNIMVIPQSGYGWFATPTGWFLRYCSSWEMEELPERMTEISLVDPGNFEFEMPLQWQLICMSKNRETAYFVRTHKRAAEFLKLVAEPYGEGVRELSLIGGMEIYNIYRDAEFVSPGDYGVIDVFGEKCTLEEILKLRPEGGIKTRLKAFGIEIFTLNARPIRGRAGNR